MNKIGIVNKPQFDIDVFSRGTAVKITDKRDSYNIDTYNGIVTSSTPLKLTCNTVMKDKSVCNKDYSIESVIGDKIFIELLGPHKLVYSYSKLLKLDTVDTVISFDIYYTTETDLDSKLMSIDTVVDKLWNDEHGLRSFVHVLGGKLVNAPAKIGCEF